MLTESAIVLSHDAVGNAYHLMTLQSRKIAPAVKPGQFVHLKIPRFGEAVLRRPFSVFKVTEESLTILYREVGVGTRNMRHLRTGDTVNLLGPLGNGFPKLTQGKFPVLVAGGYGFAALYLVAQQTPLPGVIFLGGATVRDILCVEDFEQLRWEVKIATEDGSAGKQGLVTQILTDWLDQEAAGWEPEIFACGPNGMLKAISQIAEKERLQAWLSMDRHMGCGLGACLSCVQKVRRVENGKETWQWARLCTEGPVFNSNDIIWS